LPCFKPASCKSVKMYVRDLKKDFFDVVVTSRVLVLVNSDVDSVCATKILQYLFKCDHVVYTLVPVQGKKALFNAFEQNMEGVKYCVLINCGATIPLVDFFDPDDDVVIFVADSHRPVDVTNVYNDGQIRLLMKEDPDEGIPDPDDIFRDDDSEEEEEEWEEDEYGEKRRRYDEGTLMKAREKREWDTRRQKLLFEYTQYSFYGSSTALTMYELAWKMSRDSNDLLWWAIVGHTEQYLSNKIEDDRYVLDTANIQNHVARLNGRVEGESVAVDCLKISNDKELNLTLYRHWNLYDSLKYSAYTATKFKMWTMRGEQRLAEFLAELGLPLQQCRQNFTTMDLELRQNITEIFLSKAEKYNVPNITFNSFHSCHGYQHKYCAGDMVRGVLAALEHHAKVEDGAQPFLAALDTLSRTRVELLEAAVIKAKEQQKLLVKQVQTILDTRQVVSTGPFLYTVIPEGTPNSEYLNSPGVLTSMAQFTLRAHVAVSTSKKTGGLPLVLVAPLDNIAGTCVVVGIPPITDRSKKNFFGKAFEQAAQKTSARYLLDYFDSSLIQIKSEDRTKFLDALVSLLT